MVINVDFKNFARLLEKSRAKLILIVETAKSQFPHISYLPTANQPDYLLWGILGVAGVLLVSMVAIFIRLAADRRRRRRKSRRN